jgi:hypothetical protein
MATAVLLNVIMLSVVAPLRTKLHIVHASGRLHPGQKNIRLACTNLLHAKSLAYFTLVKMRMELFYIIDTLKNFSYVNLIFVPLNLFRPSLIFSGKAVVNP